MSDQPKNSNALPKYVQISELLIRDIAAGRLMDGERLPPEREMADGLNTSVGTLRKALAILEKKGMLDRLQGSGNYIRHGADEASIYSMFRLELPEGGGCRARIHWMYRHWKSPLICPSLERPITARGFVACAI